MAWKGEGVRGARRQEGSFLGNHRACGALIYIRHTFQTYRPTHTLAIKASTHPGRGLSIPPSPRDNRCGLLLGLEGGLPLVHAVQRLQDKTGAPTSTSAKQKDALAMHQVPEDIAIVHISETEGDEDYV